MLIHRLLLVGFVCISTVTSARQTLPIPLDIQNTYQEDIRTNNGKPGKNYWQNTANYSINVNFNPDTRLVSGTVEIDYVNNSPDTLAQVVLKLYPNLYKKGMIRLMPVLPADLSNGVNITSFIVNHGQNDTARLKTEGTNLVAGIKPLYPKQTMHFSISYSYIMNKTSHIRTGEIEPGAAFLAYFFPRIAVYDDIDGWNRNQYMGTQEFYNDFCNFNVSVTVPDNYLVWATGDLMNCSEVLNDKYCNRVAAAEKNDAVTDIIDSIDLQQKNITKQNGSNTWKFTARDVTDFAFAVSNHYLWKSTSLVVDNATKRRTRVDVIFNPAHKDFYEVIDFARKTVWAMSYVFPKWPFPYSHESVFDGLDQMEYPMMVNDNPLESRVETIELTDHEIFHTMFPFYMGTNETKYGWMDEGWATIGEWLISPIIDTAIVDDYGVKAVEITAGKESDMPVMTLSTQLNGTPFFTNSYPKPGMGYSYIKDMLGDSLFTKALHYYILQWHGKHPMPYDFFNCMNTGSGKNLNWFWKRWFFDGGVPDLAIKTVTKQATGYSIIVESKGTKPVPVDLTITYTDGAIEKIHRTIAVWEKANTVTVSLQTKKAISKITMGSTHVPDVNSKDNVWEKK
jgi:hypothetical protein